MTPMFVVAAPDATSTPRGVDHDAPVDDLSQLVDDGKLSDGEVSSSSDAEDLATCQQQRADARRRRLSPTGSMDDTYLREMLGSALPEGAPSPRAFVRRSKSCGVHGRGAGDGSSSTAYRVRIGYQDEQLRERCERNAQQLLQTAFDEASADSTSAILARKALRYRKILQRMEETNVDVHDPAFDASACLGVRWQRVANDGAPLSG